MISKKNSIHNIPDTNQSFWQLSVIQLSGWTSLPILATSILMLQKNSFWGAVFTLILGNGILWCIRFGIIAMSYKKRQSTLDIAHEYLGKVGGYCIGIVLLISTLAWFIAQTTTASSALTRLITIDENPSIDKFTQTSVLLGIVSTFLCMEGIILLRKFATVIFPLLLIAFFIAIFSLPFQFPESNSLPFSLSGLTLVLGTNLGVTSDLPTFFRHSRSFKTSIAALTMIQIVSLVLAISSLYLGSIVNGMFEINDKAILDANNEILRISLVIFLFFSVIAANVANVYSASVGWEVVAPAAFVGRKEYLILGLGLTIIFIIVSNIFSVELLINISDCSLVNLCIVLILGYIIKKWRGNSPSNFDKLSYFFIWLLATAINLLQFFEIVTNDISTFTTSLTVIFCIFSFQLFLKKISKKIAY